MTDDLRTLLDRVAADVPQRDLAATAWARAGEARRRGRLVGGALSATTALVIGVFAIGATRSGEPALPSAPHTVASLGPSVSGSASGPAVTMSVSPAEEASLPWLQDSVPVAFPTRLGFDANATLPQLSRTAGVAAKAAAVLVRELPTTLHPVVYVPGLADPYLEIDTVDLKLFDADTNDPVLALGPRVIHPDGHRLGFVQPGAVVFVDLTTATMSRVAIPVVDAREGGWTINGSFVVTNGQRGWRVDPGATAATEVALPISDAMVQIRPNGSDPSDTSAQVRVYAPDGSVVRASTRPVDLGDPWAPSVTSMRGWSATGVWLTGRLESDLKAYQGIYVMLPDAQIGERLLAIPMADGQFKQGVTPLSWAGSVLIYRSDTSFDHRLLAWDIATGKQWRVSDLPRGIDADKTDRTFGNPLSVVSLAQG